MNIFSYFTTLQTCTSTSTEKQKVNLKQSAMKSTFTWIIDNAAMSSINVIMMLIMETSFVSKRTALFLKVFLASFTFRYEEY